MGERFFIVVQLFSILLDQQVQIRRKLFVCVVCDCEIFEVGGWYVNVDVNELFASRFYLAHPLCSWVVLSVIVRLGRKFFVFDENFSEFPKFHNWEWVSLCVDLFCQYLKCWSFAKMQMRWISQFCDWFASRSRCGRETDYAREIQTRIFKYLIDSVSAICSV